MGEIIYPNGTIEAISEFLFIETPENELGQCDVTLVLGNDYIDGTMAEVKKLIDTGVILPDSKIIISGATGSLNAGKEKECIRMYNSGVNNYNISPDRIVLEDAATNSYQNLEYIKAIIENDHENFPHNKTINSFNRILIIGKAFMLRRVEMCARRLGYPVEKIVYVGTVDKEGRNIGKNCWWDTDEARKRVFAEIERIGKYAIAGDLDIFTQE